jgi:hypothetical protein
VRRATKSTCTCDMGSASLDLIASTEPVMVKEFRYGFLPWPGTDIEEAREERNGEVLLDGLPDQRDRRCFTATTFWGLPLRLRGVESNSPLRSVEAFSCRKTVIGLIKGGS